MEKPGAWPSVTRRNIKFVWPSISAWQPSKSHLGTKLTLGLTGQILPSVGYTNTTCYIIIHRISHSMWGINLFADCYLSRHWNKSYAPNRYAYLFFVQLKRKKNKLKALQQQITSRKHCTYAHSCAYVFTRHLNIFNCFFFEWQPNEEKKNFRYSIYKCSHLHDERMLYNSMNKIKKCA